MRTSEQINEIAGALAKAQGAIEGAVKGSVNPHFRSKYADLGAVWDACREHLTKNGISVIQPVTRHIESNTHVTVTRLMHSSAAEVLGSRATGVSPICRQEPNGELGSPEREG
jgi:hypothetical protein